MVYFILTRSGYEQLCASGVPAGAALWLSAGVLSAEELLHLRSSGIDVTDFRDRINPMDLDDVGAALAVAGQVAPVVHAADGGVPARAVGALRIRKAAASHWVAGSSSS